ncbi:MAG: copper chaperone PCu(A)C [Roseitalea sp.]|nr:copper chaperone PCu(A)C [Roseitalea sp.]MBO6952745.1 copper chaperone PCu(A)C [Rhizobiaceae bacterium]MBO6592768.1 copper chaperone PCu(A)C [Roseitalea sp.]MBO6600489.1 copper chaperone PCu(A)C [Roseitalea sp.]MBO6612969.1 copper chaperone PCu(A)C [Roseitalea sp.]
MNKFILTAAATLLAGASAFAHEEHKAGDLVIDHPVARATPANAPVSGGYMTIRNTGEEADRLMAGAADFAGKVEIHEMVMDGDVMKMREIEGGVEIPAGGEVVLKPGGLHVMFMQLDQQLEEGAKLPATLTFEKAGDVTVTFNVESLEQIREHLGGGMEHGSMDQ